MSGPNNENSSPPNQNREQQEGRRLAEDHFDPKAKGPDFPTDSPRVETKGAQNRLDPTQDSTHHVNQREKPANDLDLTTAPELSDDALSGEPNAVAVRGWLDPKSLDDIPYHADLEDPNSVIYHAGARFYTRLGILTTVMLAQLVCNRPTTERMITDLMVVYVAYMDLEDDRVYDPEFGQMIEKE